VPAPLVAIVDAPLSLDALVARVSADQALRGEGCGAVATFVGVVRAQNAGRVVQGLAYEAYEPLATRAFERIRREISAEWPGAHVGIHHRIGRLDVGDASVIIAAGSAHRAEAFGACRYAIERVKQIAPIWKREYFDGGDVWIEGAVADPDDEAARMRARARAACA
jgi:molybdopterin synthase catalytic subunit